MANTKRKETDNKNTGTVAKAQVLQQPYGLQKPKPAEDKSTRSNFAVFQLCNGELKSFRTPVEAQDFADEHEALILHAQYFATKTAMDAYIRTASSPAKMLAAVDQTSLADLSPADKSKFQQIRAALESAKPACTINFAIKTTKKSLVAIIFVYARDELGRPVWFFKDPLPKVFQQYIAAIPSDNAFANSLLTTLQSVEQRDPDKGPEDAIMNVRKEDNRAWPQKIMYGWVDINPRSFASADEEMAWLDAMCRFTWMIAVSISSTAIFRASLQTAMSERFYAAIYKTPKFGPNFPDFMQHCKVNVTRLDNLNTLTVLEQVKTLQLFLVKNEQAEKKYPNADTVTFENNTGTKLFAANTKNTAVPSDVDPGTPANKPTLEPNKAPVSETPQKKPAALSSKTSSTKTPSTKSPSAKSKQSGNNDSPIKKKKRQTASKGQTKPRKDTASPKTKPKQKDSPTGIVMTKLNIQTLPTHTSKVALVTPPKGAPDDSNDDETESETEAVLVEATVLPDDDDE